MSGPLTNAEQRIFFSLLQRVCDYHVDQFLQMRVERAPYSWYVDISLHPSTGEPDLYEPVSTDTQLTNQRLGPPHWQSDT
jgi:hypothetical protein